MITQKESALAATSKGTGLTMSKDAVGQGVRRAGKNRNGTVCGIFHALSNAMLNAKLDKIRCMALAARNATHGTALFEGSAGGGDLTLCYGLRCMYHTVE